MTNTLIVDGYLSGNLITDGFVAAPNCVRLRTIISKLENRQPTSIWEAHVWEPGLWRNGNGLVDKAIEQLEKK